LPFAFLADMIVLVLVMILCYSTSANTPNPIIGVLVDGPSSPDCPSIYRPSDIQEDRGCFDSVYVKWIEMAGGRVVPIPYNADNDQLDYFFNSVNALLYTGGELTLSVNTTYYQTANYLFNLSLSANENGDYFPVWGTCQGFQLLSILIAEDMSVLSRNAFDSESLLLPLDFTSDISNSKLFGDASNDILFTLANKNVTVNLHHDGVKPVDFYNNVYLPNFFSVLSTNTDRKGLEFISSIESYEYPIYGVQFHPERPQFDFQPSENIGHTPEGILAMQYLSNFLISEARKNDHSFPSPEEEAEALIYNYPTTYLGNSTLIYFL